MNETRVFIFTIRSLRLPLIGQWWRARLTAGEQPSLVFATAKVGLFVASALSACVCGCLMLVILEPVSASPAMSHLVDVLWFTTFFLSTVFALSASAAVWLKWAAHHAGWTPIEFWQCCVFVCLPLVWGAWYALAWWALLLIVGSVPPAVLLTIVCAQRFNGTRAALACTAAAYIYVLRSPFLVMLLASFATCLVVALVGAVYAHAVARASFATFARDALGMFGQDAHGHVLAYALLIASSLVLALCVLKVLGELVWRGQVSRAAALVALQIDVFLLGFVVDKLTNDQAATDAEATATVGKDSSSADSAADRRRLATRYQDMQRELKSRMLECADVLF